MAPMGSEGKRVTPYARRYECWAAPLRARPGAVRALAAANRLIVWVFYAAYAVLLGAVALGCPGGVGAAGAEPTLVPAASRLAALAVLVLVPGAAFGLLSAVRARLNAPRPYERDGVIPLVPRDGAGRSFPSRHAFSAFAIAACWWAVSPAASVGLLVLACALAGCRVLAGVHYPRDVVAGALCGLAAGLLTGMLLLL